MIKVGVIDSGVPQTCDNIIASRNFSNSTSTCFDTLGHGSAVIHAISQQNSAGIYSAKIFDKTLTAQSQQVYEAIDWLLDSKVDVINMSFGLRHDITQLALICQKAISQGVILVAASPSQGAPVYPSNYSGVIRATGDARCSIGEIASLNSPQADLGAYVGDITTGIAGASIGCAWVTQAITQLIPQCNFNTKEQVLTYFHQHAKHQGVEQIWQYPRT